MKSVNFHQRPRMQSYFRFKPFYPPNHKFPLLSPSSGTNRRYPLET
jgi:hypothetical protein